MAGNLTFLIVSALVAMAFAALAFTGFLGYRLGSWLAVRRFRKKEK